MHGEEKCALSVINSIKQSQRSCTIEKTYHEDLVPTCTKNLNGRYDYPALRCWYKHGSQTKQTQHVSTHTQRAQTFESDFQIQPNLTKPPEIQELKEILQQAMTMMT